MQEEDNHLSVGKQGEEIATKFLEQKGYIILDRNYHFLQYEIDIVAFNHQEVVFVEVKTLYNLCGVFPEAAVHDKKQKALKIAAQSYLYERKLENCPARFDVISILLTGGEPHIMHFEDAFR